MRRKYKNSQMVEMLTTLRPMLKRTDKIGYAAARNHRRLSECLIEYERFRNGLIEKYGERCKDENGNDLPTITLKITSPNFKMFDDELAPFNEMEHEVELMIAKYTDAIGCLSGEEILGLDWMLED